MFLRKIIQFEDVQFESNLSFALLVKSIASGGYTMLLLTFPLMFVKLPVRKYFLWICIIPALSNLFNYIHLFQYKSPISMGAFAVIFETSPREAGEFLNLISPQQFILAIFLSALPYSILLFSKQSKSDKSANAIIIALVFLFSTMLAGLFELSHKKKWHHTHHSFENSFIFMDAKRIAYYFREKIKFNRLISMREQIKCEASQPSILDTIPQTYILILGESAARGRMSLYGYYRDTTPHLDTLDNLLIFTNVVASATQTRLAIKLVLTSAHINDLDLYYNTPSLINVANEAGFTTFWYSNQMILDTNDTETTVLAKDSHNTRFINTDWRTNSLDGNLLPYIKKAINHPATKKLLIFHTMGSHQDYGNRYPQKPEFMVGDSLIDPGHWNEKHEEINDHYDNSILYTSHIINEIINELKKLDHPVRLVYLSDHGEEVYDRPGLSSGHGSLRLSKEVVDIPFFIWHNNKPNNWPEDQMHTYLNRKYSAQDLFHTMLDLMHINTDIYIPEKSIINEDFIEEPIQIIDANYNIVKYQSFR
jgi:heptose-I-phosphate ethanolaminephosphotransferase